MMKLMKLEIVVTAILVLHGAAHAEEAATPRKTENVIFVMTDGLRLAGSVRRSGEIADEQGKRRRRRRAGARKGVLAQHARGSRELVLPFVWSVMAKLGQIFGDRNEKMRCGLRTA